jgi:Mg/Co/Ni transporter MgtE
MDTDIKTVNPENSLDAVVRHFARYNLVALPVVDENDHLLGVVTVDDVVDHMLPEDWRENPAPVVGKTSQNYQPSSATSEYGSRADGGGDHDGE